MNAADLKFLKKQFKLDATLLTVKDVYSVFINGDSREILSGQFIPLYSMDEDVQQLLLKNLKKILTGNLDVKIFEQTFNKEAANEKDNGQMILNEMVESGTREEMAEGCNRLVQKLLLAYNYEKSTVLYFVRATLNSKNGSSDFIICTVNKAETPKQQMVYNYNEKALEYKTPTEPVVNMTSPLEGFMYPVWDNGAFAHDKVLYYSSKSNKVNGAFLYSVLNCNVQLTAKQEKEYFHKIINNVVGGKIKPVQLAALYDSIRTQFEEEKDEEFRTLSPSDLKAILDSIGIEPAISLKEAYINALGHADCNFKVKNIVPPGNKKSIVLGNNQTDISIKPDYLENVHQVQMDDGDMYLLVRLTENLSTDGFNIEFESLENFIK